MASFALGGGCWTSKGPWHSAFSSYIGLAWELMNSNMLEAASNFGAVCLRKEYICLYIYIYMYNMQIKT